MLLTQQIYQAWKNEHEKGISTDADRMMFETFQALRNVARAANSLNKDIHDAFDNDLTEIEALGDYVIRVDKTLYALPAWILENE